MLWAETSVGEVWATQRTIWLRDKSRPAEDVPEAERDTESVQGSRSRCQYEEMSKG